MLFLLFTLMPIEFDNSYFSISLSTFSLYPMQLSLLFQQLHFSTLTHYFGLKANSNDPSSKHLNLYLTVPELRQAFLVIQQSSCISQTQLCVNFHILKLVAHKAYKSISFLKNSVLICLSFIIEYHHTFLQMSL